MALSLPWLGILCQTIALQFAYLVWHILQGEIIFTDRLHQVARARPPDANTTATGGNIIDIHRAISRHLAANPGEIMDAESRSRNNLEAISCQACHGEVALDAPALVRHLRISDGSWRLVHLVIRNTLQKGSRANSQHLKFTKRGLV